MTFDATTNFHFVPFLPLIAIAIIFIPLFTFLIIRLIRNDHKKHDSQKVTWIRRIAMAACAFAICIGPSLQGSSAVYVQADYSYLFVIDRTASMYSLDGDILHNRRLDVAKNDMLNLSQMLPPGKFCAISFDSTAHQDLPLTRDEQAFSNWVQSLTPEISQFSNGTNFNELHSQLTKTISDIYKYNPKNRLYLFILTDGDDNSGVDLADFSTFNDYVYGGAVIGYGTSQGANIEQYYPNVSSQTGQVENASAGNFIMTQSGEMAVSKYNEQFLHSISEKISIPLVHRVSGDVIVDSAKSIHSLYYNEETAKKNITTENYIIYPFSIILIFLIGWELTVFLMLNSIHSLVKVGKNG